MKRSKKFRKTCVALILLTGVLLPFGGTSTMAAGKRNTKASELVRPTLTVITDTPQSNELALRWKTNKKADGYLLKYRQADRKKWNSVWIRNAKTHSYMMKDRKNVGYCIQLRAYSGIFEKARQVYLQQERRCYDWKGNRQHDFNLQCKGYFGSRVYIKSKGKEGFFG